jgi:hypothetical protein
VHSGDGALASVGAEQAFSSRCFVVAGLTPFPNEAWSKQVARNLNVADSPMAKVRFLLHDRDTKFSQDFDAVFHDDAQRLRWNIRQRQTIFRLLLQDFGQRIVRMANEQHHRGAMLWRLTVETWLRRRGLIIVRQYQDQKLSTTSLKIWSHNSVGPTTIEERP